METANQPQDLAIVDVRLYYKDPQGRRLKKDDHSYPLGITIRGIAFREQVTSELIMREIRRNPGLCDVPPQEALLAWTATDWCYAADQKPDRTIA